MPAGTVTSMHISNLFRLSYWFDPSVLDHRAGNAMWLVVGIGLVWCIAAVFVVARRRLPMDIALAQALVGVLVAGVAAGRLFAIPVLGLRAGWLMAIGLAVAPFAPRLIRQALRDGLVGDCLRALAFNPTDLESRQTQDGTLRATASERNLGGSGGSTTALERSLGGSDGSTTALERDVPAAVARSVRRGRWHFSTSLAWLGVHLLGTAAVMSIIKQPLWFAPVLILLILAPHIISHTWQLIVRKSTTSDESRISNLKSLSSLLLVYAVLALRLIVGLSARITFGQFRVVDPFGTLLNLPLVLIVMSAYAFIASAYQASSTNPTLFVKAASMALVAGVVAWTIWNALTLHTQGVSGSDPYAYAQMGVDLAERGTVFHSFPLIRLTYALNIPSEPIIHVGYKLPQDVRRVATTVWPPGYAIFTALGYMLAGEQGLYLITPLVSLLSLAVIAWLASMLTSTGHGLGTGAFGLAVAALSVFLTATSYQQVEWQLIPMADIAAQLFSLLALVLALRARGEERSAFIFAALSGLALGFAFDIRYTQVLIAPAIAFALFAGQREAASPRSSALTVRLLPIVVCAMFALLAALPVLIYHTVAFGGPLQTGSEELSNFSLPSLPDTLVRITSALLSPREFGLLWPLIITGLIVLWQRSRRTLLVLATFFVPLFILHIAYAYLRPRDILTLFPILSILGALGAAWLGMRLIGTPDVRRQKSDVGITALASRQVLTAAVLIVLAFAFVLRSMDTLALPVTHGFGAFGYLVREQRASFARLGELTPQNAVIGCSLNSGAVDLHAKRLAFRPATWTPDELLKFVRALRQEHTPVFMLEDGAEVSAALSTLRQHFQLAEVARLDMPYYFPGSGSENRKVALYRVDG